MQCLRVINPLCSSKDSSQNPIRSRNDSIGSTRTSFDKLLPSRFKGIAQRLSLFGQSNQERIRFGISTFSTSICISTESTRRPRVLEGLLNPLN